MFSYLEGSFICFLRNIYYYFDVSFPSKLFCFALEFQFNVREILFTQSSDADLDCTMFANGNREAEIVM